MKTEQPGKNKRGSSAAARLRLGERCAQSTAAPPSAAPCCGLWILSAGPCLYTYFVQPRATHEKSYNISFSVTDEPKAAKKKSDLVAVIGDISCTYAYPRPLRRITEAITTIEINNNSRHTGTTPSTIEPPRTYLHGSGINVGLEGLVRVGEVGERVGSVGVGGERAREDEASRGGGGSGGLFVAEGIEDQQQKK